MRAWLRRLLGVEEPEQRIGEAFCVNQGPGNIPGAIVYYSGRYQTDTGRVQSGPAPTNTNVEVIAIEAVFRMMVPLPERETIANGGRLYLHPSDPIAIFYELGTDR